MKTRSRSIKKKCLPIPSCLLKLLLAASCLSALACSSAYASASFSFPSPTSSLSSVSFSSSSGTEIFNAGSGTLMSHFSSSEQSYTRSAEYEVSSVSSSEGDLQSSAATSHMQVDESIVSGKATYGVVSGGGSSRSSATGMKSTAWKNPEIEIDEEYIGTYHISKNFTISEDHVARRAADDWLDIIFLGGGNPYSPPYPTGLFNLTGNSSLALLSADDVFDGRRQ